jgi:AcrR family transcriptional regulator
VTDVRTTASRPRNRRQLIITAAAAQFRATGYHNVGIVDIAEAVGITSAALYRHFTSKQDLLRAAVQDAIDRLPGAFAAYGPGADLEQLLRAACAVTVQGPAAGVLWGREMVHLPAQVHASLRSQVLAAVAPLRTSMAAARPDLDGDSVDLLLWAVLGVLASDAYHAVRIDARLFQERLYDVCRGVVGVSLPPHRAARPPRRLERPGLLPASRPEAILTAAVRLFRAKGYHVVGVDDIGAEAGITGATIYYHFENKAAILAASLNRCLQAMLFDLSGALDSSRTAGEALDKVLGYFVRICVEHGQVVGALQKEAINLPDDDRRALFQAEREYRDEWVALLVRHRDDLSQPEAQILVRAAISSIGGLMAIPRIEARAGLADELTQIGRAILGLHRPGRSTDPLVDSRAAICS